MAYSEYDSIKLKMKIPDDSLFDEIQLYMQEVDDLINNRLRARLGTFNVRGDPVILPLTATTKPSVDNELKSIAADLVEGKFFLKESEKPLKWDTAVKALENYLDQKFGWARDLGQTILRELTISPTQGAISATVTMGGTGWRINDEVTFQFDGIVVTTTPTLVVTDSIGAFSGVTFTVPTNEQPGVIEVKVLDGQGGQTIRFLVTA